MACKCDTLKAEVLSQRELMTEWFQTLMIEIRDAKAELVELIKSNTFNIGERQKTTDQPLTSQQSSLAEHLSVNAFLEGVDSGLRYGDAASDSNPVSLSLEPTLNPEMEPTTDPAFKNERISPKMEPEPEEIFVGFSLSQNKHSNDDEPLDEQVTESSALNQLSSVGSACSSAVVQNEHSETWKSCDYNDQCDLTIEKRSHTDEKPFRCRLCEKHFKRKFHLTDHMMVHTGEKPFACSQCSYRTSRKFNLQNHLRIHTGEKPFQCHLCDFRGTRSAVAHHRKRKHQAQV